MREKYINQILDLSGDEFETKEDLIELAKESNSQLRIRLNHILLYEDNITNEYRAPFDKRIIELLNDIL